jgi:hypothetical protein
MTPANPSLGFATGVEASPGNTLLKIERRPR